MIQLHIVRDFHPVGNGGEQGTESNPYVARTALELNDLMRRISLAEFSESLNNTSLWTDEYEYVPHGYFPAWPTYQWGPYSRFGWRLGPRSRVRFPDQESGFYNDWDTFPDEWIDLASSHLIISTQQWLRYGWWHFINNINPELAWAGVARGQSVIGGTLDLRYSKGVDRWQAKNVMFRPSAVIITGHQAVLKPYAVLDTGAWRPLNPDGSKVAESAESFPLIIVGGMDMPDRNKFTSLDPAKYVFDHYITEEAGGEIRVVAEGLLDEACSHQVNCKVDGGRFPDSNDQVTARMILGSTGQDAAGNWHQLMRRHCYHMGGDTTSSGENHMQGHTIYQALSGKIMHNTAKGIQVQTYGDYLTTRGVEVDFNTAVDCYHAVQLMLSPPTVPPDDEITIRLKEQFSHSDYKIGVNNQFSTRGANVRLDTLGPSTPTRFIRNIEVPMKYTLDDKGVEGLVRPGSPATPLPPKPKGKGGCLLFFVPGI